MVLDVSLEIPESTPIRTEDEARSLLQHLMKLPEVAYDTETTGLDKINDHIVFFSFSDGVDRWAIERKFLPLYAPLLSEEGGPDLLYWNAPFDMAMSVNSGVPPHEKTRHLDGMMLAWMLDPDPPHGLKKVTKRFVGNISMDEFNKKFGKTAVGVSFEDIHAYASLDAWTTWYNIQEIRKILDSRGQMKYVYETEVPFTYVIHAMERLGIAVDKPMLDKLAVEYLSEIEEIKEMLFKFVGHRFNPNSNDDLTDLFYGVYKRPVEKTTSGGQYGVPKPCTDKEVMSGWVDKYRCSAAALVLKFREYSKMYSTYIKGMANKIQYDGRIHPTIKQIGSRTGRLAYAQPNLQNLPRDSDIRKAFIAAAGYTIFAADYDQAEIVMGACLSGDRYMLNAILAGECHHARTASRLYNIPYEDIISAKNLKDAHHPINDYDKECLQYRFWAKTAGFGINYGRGARELAKSLNVSIRDAQKIINDYLGLFPEFTALMHKTHAFCKEHGYVETIRGRRRYIKGISGFKFQAVSEAERQAFNCLPYKTEALTKRGWVAGPDLTTADELLTKNADTGYLEWQPLLDIKLHPNYKGKLVRFESKAFKAESTPEHRWLVYDKSSRSNKCRRTNELSRLGDHRIHRTGKYRYDEDDEDFTDSFVKLAGWILTDGHFKAGGTNMTSMYVCQSLRAHPENCEEIEELLDDLCITPTVYTTEDTQVRYWNFHNDTAKLLRRLFPGRVLSVNFLSHLSYRQCRLLLDTMLNGDGSVGAQSVLYARSEKVAAAFQALCVLCGLASNSVYEPSRNKHPESDLMSNIPNSNGCWHVSVLRRDKAQVTHEQVTEREVEQPVWCPVVGNTYFVARHEGCVFVTGNTVIQGSIGDIVRQAMINCFFDKRLRDLDVRMVLQVHDELNFEVPVEYKDEAVAPILECMNPANMGIELQAPLNASGGFGPNIQAAKG